MPKKCIFNVKKNHTDTLHETAINDTLGFEEMIQHEWCGIVSLLWMSKE